MSWSKPSRRAPIALLHSTGSRAWRVGLPTRGAGFHQQALECFRFAVEHRTRVLTPLRDELKRIEKNLVEFVAPRTEPDWRQSAYRIHCRLRLAYGHAAHLQAR